ncbi:hypothetical protein TNCV_4499881 [Trichonephila clavipes]|nr:hypothetical protein TNCV_4499881 [Trichonephila clavipes]
MLTSLYLVTREHLETNLIILNHGQLTIKLVNGEISINPPGRGSRVVIVTNLRPTPFQSSCVFECKIIKTPLCRGANRDVLRLVAALGPYVKEVDPGLLYKFRSQPMTHKIGQCIAFVVKYSNKQ